MATSYSQVIKTDIEQLDYNSACIISRWIFNSLDKIPNERKVDFEIYYRLGDISCSTDNFEEFIEKTYGQSPDIISIRISKNISFNISGNLERKDGGIGIRKFVEIRIHSDTIILLKQVIEELRKQMTMPNKTPDSIIQQPTLEINIGGNLHMSGSAIGEHNQVTTTQIPAKKPSFWKGVWEKIVANLVWWILGLIALSIATYLGIKGIV